MTGIFGNQLLYLIGLSMTNSDTAAIYQPVSPMLTGVLAVWPWRYERPSWLRAGGFVVGVGGLLLMVLPSLTSHAKHTASGARFAAGNLFLSGNALCASVYFLLQKPLFRRRYSAEMITTFAYISAALALLISCLVGFAHDPDAWKVNGGAEKWGALVYAAVICSTIDYQLMTWANQYLDASITSCYCILQPVTTGILAYFTLSEPLTWKDGVGSLLILGGLAAVGAANSTKAAVGEEGEEVDDENAVRHEGVEGVGEEKGLVVGTTATAATALLSAVG